MEPLSTIDPYPNDPYPTFTAVEPRWISRLADQTPEYLTAVQHYEAAKHKYYKDLDDWRTRRRHILGRNLTNYEKNGIFDESDPERRELFQPTAEKARAVKTLIPPPGMNWQDRDAWEKMTPEEQVAARDRDAAGDGAWRSEGE